MARSNEESIQILGDPAGVTASVEAYRQPLDENIITLTELGSSAIRFADAVFPDAGIDQIYAQHNIREGEGRGPHFDIYKEGISSRYPWLGVFNLAGRCSVEAAVMPKALSKEYRRLYPQADDPAFAARRHFGALVLDSSASTVYTATLEADQGLVLPQQKRGPDIIHKVVPENPLQPGSFIKMVVPKNESEILADLREQKFMPLDELLTKGLGEPESEDAELKVVPLPSSTPRRHDVQRSGRAGLSRLD